MKVAASPRIFYMAMPEGRRIEVRCLMSDVWRLMSDVS